MSDFENNTNDNVVQRPGSHKVSRRAIIVAIVFFGLIVAGMFTFAFLKKNEIQEEVILDTQNQPATEVRFASITRVNAAHYFIDGVHTVVGEIPMPTPCDLLESEAVVMESYPEQINIGFNVINNANFCEDIITAQRFKVSASASKEATFSATFMGRTVDLNLIPAAEGELPDDFELFIKG